VLGPLLLLMQLFVVFFFNWGAVLSIVDGGKIAGCSNSATQQWLYCRYFTIFCAK